jgi:hypothetical protein
MWNSVLYNTSALEVYTLLEKIHLTKLFEPDPLYIIHKVHTVHSNYPT